MHEKVHQEIYKRQGIDSRVDYGIFVHMTIPEKNCETENCLLAHDINDAIGYNIQAFLMLLFIGFTILILLKEDQILSDKILYHETQNIPQT